MTPMKEDYLKIIFELGGSHKKVSNKDISLGLGIAGGSVTEMVSKLSDEGLVVHEPYAGISLTEKGQKYAAELVRKHRLWETFLVDKLHYNFADVHSEAEVLEHQTSDRLATARKHVLMVELFRQRVDSFLMFHTVCWQTQMMEKQFSLNGS